VSGAAHDDIVIPWLVDESARAAHVRARRAGVTHRRALTPRAPAAGQPVAIEVTAGPACPDGVAWVEVGGTRTSLELASADWDTLIGGYVRRYRGELPGRPAGTVVSYRLGVGEVEADGGERHGYCVGAGDAPAWARQAIVYQVFVDRFAAGPGADWPAKGAGPADRYGGTLLGLLGRLGHIVDLGANTVWLNPIHPSCSYHGYDVTDYLGVEPGLGSLADFDRLVAAAHDSGLRVVLDFVSSHVSSFHPTFAAARSDRSSPYLGWYRFSRWPDAYDTFFGVETMPSLNHANVEVRRHLVEAATFWLERGVDGFRLDYALGSSPEFWAEFRAAVKAAHPDCWLFGEVVETPETQLEYEGLLDGCLDFALVEALRETFGYRTRTPQELAAFLEAQECFFPRFWSRPSFLDNHDMNRFSWIAGGDRRRLHLAALCQFTLPGPPIVYYGTEVGLSQQYAIKDESVWGGDRHARLPMLWGADQDAVTLDVFRQLARLRAARPELCDGSTFVVSADEKTLRYTRGPLLVSLDAEAGSGSIADGPDELLRLPAA
jgi:cyclomaltodextrinase